MLEQIETLDDGWITTRELKDEAGVHITGKYRRPYVGRLLNLMYFPAVMPLCFLYMVAESNRPLGDLMIGSFGMAFLFWVFGGFWVWRWVMSLIRRKVDVKILPQHIQIKRWHGYRTFSRDVPLEFRVEQHHKAPNEEAQEIKAGKPRNRWYREAIEVVMQYGEKRIPIAEMRMIDMEKSRALVIRLQSWCENFDQAVKRMEAGQIKPAGEEQVISEGDFGPAPDIR